VIPTDTSLITEEYVEQVLDALFKVSHEVLVLTMRERGLSAEAIALVEATTPEARVPDGINELVNLAAEDFAGLKENPEPITATVMSILNATPVCVLAEVDLDETGLVQSPADPPGARTFARLVPATEEQVGSGLNPTAWTIDSLPVTSDGTEPVEQC
jgi:hypothetical protein